MSRQVKAAKRRVTTTVSPIALIEDGDIIDIDAEGVFLSIQLDGAMLASVTNCTARPYDP